VTALPTIYHVKDGEFRQYHGSRDKDEFINFVEEKKWSNTEPIPSWKSPSSFQMSAVSYFFKLSMVLRAIHTSLIEEYGLPYWGSYIVFALATVIIGALLGLILVCIVDFVFPPRAAAQTEEHVEKEKPSEHDQDIVDDAEEADDGGEESQEEHEASQSDASLEEESQDHPTSSEHSSHSDDSSHRLRAPVCAREKQGKRIEAS